MLLDKAEASQPSSIESGEARCTITPSAPGDNASETNMHTKNLDTGNQIWEHITLHTPPCNNIKHHRNEEERPRSRQMELGGYKPHTLLDEAKASQPSSIETGAGGARCTITPSSPRDNASEIDMHTKTRHQQPDLATHHPPHTSRQQHEAPPERG